MGGDNSPIFLSAVTATTQKLIRSKQRKKPWSITLQGSGAGRGVFACGEDFRFAQMRTLFSTREKGLLKPRCCVKNEHHPRGVVFVFGAGRGIRTPVALGQTVFKTFRMLPESSRIIPNPPRFSAEFSLFFAPSRKFARKLRESCEKPLKNAPLQV